MLKAATPRMGAIDQIIRWWEGGRKGQSIPRRSCFISANLWTVLPDIFLLEITIDPTSGKHLYRCQLTGTEIDYSLGVNLTTPYAPDFPVPFEIQAIAEEFDNAIATHAPICGSRCIERPQDRHFEYDWAIAPLANEGRTDVVELVGAIEFRCIFDLPTGRPPGCPGRETCQRMAICDLPAGCGLRI